MLSPFSFVFFDGYGAHYNFPYSFDDYYHCDKFPKFYDESGFDDSDF